MELAHLMFLLLLYLNHWGAQDFMVEVSALFTCSLQLMPV